MELFRNDWGLSEASHKVREPVEVGAQSEKLIGTNRRHVLYSLWICVSAASSYERQG